MTEVATQVDEWAALDGAAEANLTPAGVARFHEYKAELQRDGHGWVDDACEILTGYIWEEIEGAFE